MRRWGKPLSSSGPKKTDDYDISLRENERERDSTYHVLHLMYFCHSQQHEAAWGDDRDLVQYSDWDQRCGSSLQDPTPSMSWDNLTLEPSPALANTESSKAAEGMNLAQYNEKMDNDIDTDDC